jgi:hypothetical protein
VSYPDVTALDGAISRAIHSLLSAPPTDPAELAALIASVRTAAAYTDHTGNVAHSEASIRAAVLSIAGDSELTLRNELLESMRAMLADHESRIAALELA